jgi:hypothetical protein
LVHLYRWEKKTMNDEGPDFAFGADATEFWLQDRAKSIDYRRIPLSGNGEPRAATGFTETISPNREWYLVTEPFDGFWDWLDRPNAMLFRSGEARPWLSFVQLPASLYFDCGRAFFSPNSQYLAAGSNTGTVTLMHLPSLKREIDAYDRLLTNAEKP